MMKEEYENSFKPWYDEFKQSGQTWIFQEQFRKYCRADVEVLSKMVLKFRKLFKDQFDIDPFRYATIGSLCVNLYRAKFMPARTMVSNENSKNDSKVCKEWLHYLRLFNPESSVKIEHPIWIERNPLKDSPYYKEGCTLKLYVDACCEETPNYF